MSHFSCKNAVSHQVCFFPYSEMFEYLQEAGMRKQIRKLFGEYLIRIAGYSVSSPSRAGFYQPDVRKLKRNR